MTNQAEAVTEKDAAEHAAAEFSKVCGQHCVVTSVTTAKAALTVRVKEIADAAHASLNIKGKGHVEIMPEDVLSEVRGFDERTKRLCRANGWEIKQEKKTKYLLMAYDIHDILEEFKQIKIEWKDYLIERTKDWDAYVEECIANLGDLRDNGDWQTYFPYPDRRSYLREFVLKMDTKPCVGIDSIPAGIADNVFKHMAGGLAKQNQLILDSLRGGIIERCEWAQGRINATSQEFTRKTFKSVGIEAEKAMKFNQGCDPVIDKVVPNIYKILAYIDRDPKQLENGPVAQKVYDSFGKCVAALQK